MPILVGWFGNWKQMIDNGNESYLSQNYDAAAVAFQQATLDKPNSSIAYYNLGAALYQKGKYQQAAAAFQTSIVKGNLPEEAALYYNLGNAQFQIHDLKGAIDNYKYSLRLNPFDNDAKHNLALAQQLLNKQEQSASQPQQDTKNEEKSTKKETSQMSEMETLRILESLSENESRRRQKILKQQLNTGYRRDKDW